MDILFFMRNTPAWLRKLLMLGLFFPSVYGIGWIAGNFFIIFWFGLDRYRDGLRFASPRQGVLTDGTELSFLAEFVYVSFVLVMVFGSLFLSLWAIDRMIGLLGRGKSQV